jgi:hypothetical protein
MEVVRSFRKVNNDLPEHTAPQPRMHLQCTEDLKSYTRLVDYE